MALAFPLTGGVAAQDGLSVSIDVPNEVAAGESASVSASVSVPDLTGSYEQDATLTLYVGGEQVNSKIVTVQDGETVSVSFSHTFQSEGSTTVKVEGSVTMAGQTFSDSASKTVDVVVPTATPTSPPTPTTETTSAEGAAFAVPESLEDEVADYRNSLSQDVPGYAFVLATENELHLVFTETEPRKGVGSVKGVALDRTISYGNLSLGVIAATSASFDTTGTSATVQDVADNSDEYELELVSITATHRRVTTLTDPDEGDDVTFSSTSGILIDNPQTGAAIFQNVGATARAFSQDPSTEQIDAIVSDPRRTHLHTVSFETKFWTDAEATVEAIVIDPGSAARRFISEVDQPGLAHSERGEPLLYVVDRDLQPRSMDSVSTITAQSSSLDGEVVEVQSQLYQEQMSVQETLEHNSPCGEDRLQVKETCINVVQDELLHAGVAWNEVPQSRNDVLFIVGVSSRHQDSPNEVTKGQYRIVGEVVSTARINESLPEGSVLIVYDLERVGDIDYDALQAESRQVIENSSALFTSRLRTQVSGDAPQSMNGATERTASNTGANSETQTSTSGGQQTSGSDQSSDPETAKPQDNSQQTNGDNPINIQTPGFSVYSALIAVLIVLFGRFY